MSRIQWVAALEAGGAKITDAGHRALGRNPEQLKQICAFCGALIRDGALTPEGHASHGACVPCAKEWRRDAGLPE